MSIAFWILCLLILWVPATLIIDGLVVQSLIGATAAIGLLAVAAGLRPLEGAHLAKSLRPLLLLAALPLIWMLLQLMPMPLGVLAHPMWASAADALHAPLTAHMTIDFGDTVIDLWRALVATALIVLAAAATVDRQRAEWILFLTTAVATLAALATIADRLAGGALVRLLGGGQDAALHALAGLGTVLALTSTNRAVERFETRGSAGQMSWRGFLKDLSLCLTAEAICLGAVITAAPPAISFATGCGIALFLAVIAIRRLGLGRVTTGAILLGIAVAAAVVANGAASRSSEPTLRFAATAPDGAVQTAERMIADNAVGSGAGTFAGLSPIYGDSGETADAAPTFAAAMSIELGRPAPYIAALLALAMTAVLLRGSFERGRDSFYATAAAGGTVTLLIEAFADASLTATAVVIVAATLVGLGLAQRMSRSLQ